jgi:predicted aminopeptidase
VRLDVAGRRRRQRRLSLAAQVLRGALAIAGVPVGACACGPLALAGQQLELLNQQVPLARAQQRERDPRRRRLLALVPEVVGFGRDVMQLRPRRSYTGYFETERRGIVWVLSASERTRLVPRLFSYPIVGDVAYRSFYAEADARQAAAELEAEGYDAFVNAATAYSTLGYLRDPVTTIMMRKGTIAFIEVLLHEMTHERLYVAGHSELSEQLASFVGERGVEQFVARRYGTRGTMPALLEAHLARRRVREAVARATLEELRALYDSPVSDAEKLRRRLPIFAALSAKLAALSPDATPEELEVDNARMLQLERYLASGPELAALWRRAGGSWVRFWPLVEAYAQALP